MDQTSTNFSGRSMVYLRTSVTRMNQWDDKKKVRKWLTRNLLEGSIDGS